MVEVKLENIRKVYNSPRIEAVKPTSITIEHGEFFTLVGPSGCGKTTLLRTIAGLETPTEGEIYFDGERVTDLSTQQRDIAMVFQNIALYPHMTCYDNIGYGLKVRKDTEGMDEKIRSAAELLEIGDQLDKKPAQLSGGQQQRVALGRAIVRRPNLILLDEPMSDLDAKLKAELRVVVQELHKEIDTTLIYVTHNQKEAMTMSTTVGLMNGGEFAQIDKPDDIFQNPTNEFSATFIGQPSMNVIEAPIRDDTLVLEQADGLERSIRLGDHLEELPEEVLQNGKVKLGFRPRHVTLSSDVEKGVLTLDYKLYEQDGDEANIYAETLQGDDIIAISNERPTYERDSKISITDISTLFIFDPRSGETLLKLTNDMFEKQLN